MQTAISSSNLSNLPALSRDFFNQMRKAARDAARFLNILTWGWGTRVWLPDQVRGRQNGSPRLIVSWSNVNIYKWDSVELFYTAIANTVLQWSKVYFSTVLWSAASIALSIFDFSWCLWHLWWCVIGHIETCSCHICNAYYRVLQICYAVLRCLHWT